MEEDLKEMLKDLEILNGMKASCVQYEKALNEKFSKFVKEKIGYTDEALNPLRLLAKALNVG